MILYVNFSDRDVKRGCIYSRDNVSRLFDEWKFGRDI